jgi:hypothetical protein
MLLPGENQILPHRQFRKHLQSWKVRLTPERFSSDGRNPVTTLPSTLTSPPVGVSWPRMQLKSVDLPQPFGPIRPEDLALLHVEADAVDRLDAAKALLDVADFEDRGHGAVSSRDLATARSAEAALVRRSAR